ncbi:MAG: hypothetical protein KDD84_24285, partial [Caldilineaceae bacterium]|nr:hypothetical protein [Caldilineaceae bacterium]
RPEGDPVTAAKRHAGSGVAGVSQMNDEPSVVLEPIGWPMKGLNDPQWHLRRMKLVARSASGQLWKHCEARPLAQIVVYPREKGPRCDFERDAKGRIRIGLNTRPLGYAQQAYQFAHEFCHVVANHSRGGERHDARHANHWLEECFCEAASLFSLRRMAEEWTTHSEFSFWTTDKGESYAFSLNSYAQDRINDVYAVHPPNKDISEWFKGKEQLMRDHPIATVDSEKDNAMWNELRGNYNVIATRLLPLFESNPENWEALSFLNLTPHRDNKPLAEHLADWKSACPHKFNSLVEDLERLFLPPVTGDDNAA